MGAKHYDPTLEDKYFLTKYVVEKGSVAAATPNFSKKIGRSLSQPTVNNKFNNMVKEADEHVVLDGLTTKKEVYAEVNKYFANELMKKYKANTVEEALRMMETTANIQDSNFLASLGDSAKIIRYIERTNKLLEDRERQLVKEFGKMNDALVSTWIGDYSINQIREMDETYMKLFRKNLDNPAPELPEAIQLILVEGEEDDYLLAPLKINSGIKEETQLINAVTVPIVETVGGLTSGYEYNGFAKFKINKDPTKFDDLESMLILSVADALPYALRSVDVQVSKDQAVFYKF